MIERSTGISLSCLGVGETEMLAVAFDGVLVVVEIDEALEATLCGLHARKVVFIWRKWSMMVCAVMQNFSIFDWLLQV